MLLILLVLSPILDLFKFSPTNYSLAETEDGHKKVSHVEELSLIEEDLSASYILTNDLDLSQLKEWKPLGSEGKPFTGEFLGNGHKVMNMDEQYLNEPSKGLFKVMSADAEVDVDVEFLQKEVKETSKNQAEEKEVKERKEEAENTKETEEREVEREDKKETEEKGEIRSKQTVEEKTKAGSRQTNQKEVSKKQRDLPIRASDPVPDLPSDFKPLKFNDVFRKPIGTAPEFLSPTQLQITPNRQNQRGAIWSKEQLDLKKPFAIRAALYLGNKDIYAADGITLTFHNDERMDTWKESSVIGSVGVGLGAYGTGTNAYVHQALSIEVDTYHNSDSMDYEVRNSWQGHGGHDGHLAFVRPKPNNTSKTGEHMQATEVYPALSNGQWHSLDVTWDPVTSEMTYEFDNFPKKSLKLNNLNDWFGSTNVYWGFTGSTGQEFAKNVVAFSELPQTVKVDQTASIKNKTEGTSPNQSIEAANNQTLTYQVNTLYSSPGAETWRDGVVKVTLPKGFDYVEGTASSNNQPITGQVTFNPRTRELSFPSISLNDQVKENKLSFDLKLNAASEGRHAIKVKASSPVLDVTGNDVLVTVKKPVTGQVKVHFINERDQAVLREPVVMIGADGEDYKAEAKEISGYVLKKDKLPANQTGKYIAGETIDVTFLYREGSLYISEVPDQINFNGKISSVDETYFFNKSEMNDSLIVMDEREKGADWSLDLKIKEDLTGKKTSRLLKNALHYRTEEGKDVLLNKEFQTVIEIEDIDLGGGIKLKRYNLSRNWAEGKEGFYLKVAGSSVLKDEYKGELSWSLTDAP